MECRTLNQPTYRFKTFTELRPGFHFRYNVDIRGLEYLLVADTDAAGIYILISPEPALSENLLANYAKYHKV